LSPEPSTEYTIRSVESMPDFGNGGAWLVPIGWLMDHEMPDDLAVVRRPVTIVNALGLHLRAADQFVMLARSFESKIWVECRGARANGTSILELACLAAECGATIDVQAQGPDAAAAIDALAELARIGFSPTEHERGGEA
jgi:phosphocarrier protein HPr